MKVAWAALGPAGARFQLFLIVQPAPRRCVCFGVDFGAGCRVDFGAILWFRRLASRAVELTLTISSAGYRQCDCDRGPVAGLDWANLVCVVVLSNLK